MTNTMLGELSRLFQAEGKKAQTLSSQIRLNAIAADLRQRQYAGAELHSHQCFECKTVWSHDGSGEHVKEHTCPRCGMYQGDMVPAVDSRQYAGAVPGATMASPLQLASTGQNLGTAASSGPLPIGASLSGPSMTAPQPPTDISSPTVSGGAQIVQASGPSASTLLLGAAVGLGLVIILTRK